MLYRMGSLIAVNSQQILFVSIQPGNHPEQPEMYVLFWVVLPVDLT